MSHCVNHGQTPLSFIGKGAVTGSDFSTRVVCPGSTGSSLCWGPEVQSGRVRVLWMSLCSGEDRLPADWAKAELGGRWVASMAAETIPHPRFTAGRRRSGLSRGARLRPGALLVHLCFISVCVLHCEIKIETSYFMCIHRTSRCP